MQRPLAGLQTDPTRCYLEGLEVQRTACLDELRVGAAPCLGQYVELLIVEEARSDR